MKNFIKLSLLTLMATGGVSFVCACQNNSPKYVKANTYEEFQLALSKQNKFIQVGDIDFENKITTFNYDITIKPINEKATFKNGHFIVEGPNTVGESISLLLNGIEFDGGYDLSSIDFNKTDEFKDIFGSERENERCINADKGYFNLSINNCEIHNYVSDIGPVLYTENSQLEDNKIINMSGCEIYNNVSTYDTIHLSNNKLNVTIKDSKFHDNYGYKGTGFNIANGACLINGVEIYNNHFTCFGVNQDNFQLAGGGAFIGGPSVKIMNSTISNNYSTYGGGLCVVPAYAGNGSVVVENVTFKDNSAKYGGAVTCFSLSGEPISFINCEFLNNKAETGSVFFTETYAKFNKKNNGGLLNLYFSTFGLNEANDTNTFDFYNKESTKGQIGNVSVKGCFLIGDDTYQSKEDDYNFFYSKEQAIQEGIIDEGMLSNMDIRPIKGSKADVKIPNGTYSKWSDDLNNYKVDMSVGKNKTIKSSSVLFRNIFVISLIALVSILLIVLLSLYLKRRTRVVQMEVEASMDKRPMYLKELNERERQVVELMVNLKKRKEIADTLNYSENTIKKDLSSIYIKLRVKDKTELITKYRDLLINQK